MTPLLKLENFGVAYGDKVVLRNIQVELPPRGCTVLLGPSGTGKSTLLRTLAGFNNSHPALRTWGEAQYQGRELAEGNRPAMVLQKSQFLISTVWENLVFEMRGRSSLNRRQQMERIAGLLEQTGQSHWMDRLDDKVVNYSAAQQRAIALLRQALSEPALLMVDEPMTNLPAQDVLPLQQTIRVLARDRALLVVSHNQVHARELADQVVLIASGITQETADAARFFSAPQTEAARQFIRTGACEESGADAADADADADAVQPAGPVLPPARPGPRDATGAKPASWGPRGFVWLIRGHVAGVPQPGIVRDVEFDLGALREVGVTRLVSLTETPFPAQGLSPYGIGSHASPIPDMQAPSFEQMVALCQDIDRFLANREVVAVHCKAGLGRTGTVLAAFRMWDEPGAPSALEAIEYVRRLEPAMIQSQVQVDFLEAFAEKLRSLPARRRGGT